MVAAKSNELSAQRETKEYKTRRSPKLRIAFCLVIIGLVLIAATLRTASSGHFFEHWLTTDGVIINSSIVRQRRMKFPQSVSAQPQFIFAFRVKGRLYTNKEKTFDQNDDQSVNDLVAGYPDGKKVVVHYLENEPSESYFEHKGDSSHSPFQLVVFFVGWGLLLAGLQMALKLKRDAMKSTKNSENSENSKNSEN
jgi:hypothetical protein